MIKSQAIHAMLIGNMPSIAHTLFQHLWFLRDPYASQTNLLIESQSHLHNVANYGNCYTKTQCFVHDLDLHRENLFEHLAEQDGAARCSLFCRSFF
jgi:hypothetical protein